MMTGGATAQEGEGWGERGGWGARWAFCSASGIWSRRAWRHSRCIARLRGGEEEEAEEEEREEEEEEGGGRRREEVAAYSPHSARNGVRGECERFKVTGRSTDLPELSRRCSASILGFASSMRDRIVCSTCTTE